MQLNKNVELILAAIETVIYRGDADNFVIFHLNDNGAYIQFLAAKGDYEIYCEAVHNDYLEKSDQLNDSQISTLKNLGWLNPVGINENYHLTHQVDSEKSRLDLAKLLWKTAVLVYKCKSIDKRALNYSVDRHYY